MRERNSTNIVSLVGLDFPMITFSFLSGNDYSPLLQYQNSSWYLGSPNL